MKTSKVFGYGTRNLIRNFAVIFVLAALSLTGCPTGSGDSSEDEGDPRFSDIDYIVVQVGGENGTLDSTGIRFIFGEPIADLYLTEDDITVTDGSGSVTVAEFVDVQETELTLGITVNTPGSVSVKITKAGINEDAKLVTVHKRGVIITGITWIAEQVGGIVNVKDSTGLKFTFSESVAGLTAADITVSGAAEKSWRAALTGSGTVFTLSPIVVSAGGNATVSVSKSGVEAGAQAVAVYKELPKDFGGITITPNTSVITGTELTATVSPKPAGITYQWKLNGEAIANAVNIYYTPATAGSYTITVKAPGYNEKTSAELAVSGGTLATLTGDVIITDGTDEVVRIAYGEELTADYAGTEAVTYQWNLNGEKIASGTNATFTPTAVGVYNVTIEGPPSANPKFAPKTSVNITAYATITFDLNSGDNWGSGRTGDDGTPTGTIAAEDLDVFDGRPIDPPVRTGFVFDGWYTAPTTATTVKQDFIPLITTHTDVYALWRYALPLTTIAAVTDYLTLPTPADEIIGRPDVDTATGGATVEDFAPLPVKIALGNPTLATSRWAELLEAIADADKYVALDLSESTLIGKEFANPPAAHTDSNDGKEFIVKLTLPTIVNTIKKAEAANSGDPVTKADTAFVNFDNLTTLVAANVGTVGPYAFLDYDQLTSVSFPGATTISDHAFAGCTDLVSVDFPKAISIGTNVFEACDSLYSVILPKATSIGVEAFKDCVSLDNVSLPVATSIDTSAFTGCAGLASLSFPNATSIAATAFENCIALTDVSLPKATSIDKTAFDGCTGLTSVSFPEANIIGENAFEGFTSLISVNIPKATSIGKEAFKDCTGLSSVSFPVVTEIGESAFAGDKGLTSISFPVAIKIGEGAFTECKGLTSVSFPEADNIGVSAFEDCSSIQSVDFPKTRTIGASAFAGCDSLLGGISFPVVRTIGSEAFANTKVTILSLPAVQRIGDDVFLGKLTNITINYYVAFGDADPDDGNFAAFIDFYEDGDSEAGTYWYDQVRNKWNKQQ